MQILGLLGMYFDAVVVEVKTFTFIQICSGHAVRAKGNFLSLFPEETIWKISKLYALILTIFWKKGGKLFKGRYYLREDII